MQRPRGNYKRLYPEPVNHDILLLLRFSDVDMTLVSGYYVRSMNYGQKPIKGPQYEKMIMRGFVIADMTVAHENPIDVKAQKQRQPEQAYIHSSVSSLERNNADNLKFVQKRRERQK